MCLDVSGCVSMFLEVSSSEQDRHFDPEQSSVLDMILQDDEKEMREVSSTLLVLLHCFTAVQWLH